MDGPDSGLGSEFRIGVDGPLTLVRWLGYGHWSGMVGQVWLRYGAFVMAILLAVSAGFVRHGTVKNKSVDNYFQNSSDVILMLLFLRNSAIRLS